MKNILYISNIEVPYRTVFFNQLAQKYNLTVLYERRLSSNRDTKWVKSEKKTYKNLYLDGINVKNEYSFSFKILKHLFSKEYDYFCIGCMNSPVEIMAIYFLKLMKKKYIINIDGEYFFNNKGLKKSIKKHILKKGPCFIAGEENSKHLHSILESNNIIKYHFSSLTINDIKNNAQLFVKKRNNKYLIVGQYEDYKGIDLVINVAKENPNIKFMFVGAGNKADLLKNKVYKEMNLSNIEVISFLPKKELFELYAEVKCLILPSRAECWGLVINEAASFGCPIISSNKVGASLDFLSGEYSRFLFESGNYKSLIDKIYLFEQMNQEELYDYMEFLLNKTKEYSIEKCVEEFVECINSL